MIDWGEVGRPMAQFFAVLYIEQILRTWGMCTGKMITKLYDEMTIDAKHPNFENVLTQASPAVIN